MPVLLLISFGMLTVWALVQEVSRLENEQLVTAFSAASRDRILAVQREIQSRLNVVQDIGSFFDASRKVRRGQFREFVQPVLKRDPSVRSLQWVERVTAEKREEFLRTARISFPPFRIYAAKGVDTPAISTGEQFPLLFSHPYTRGKTPLGLDLATVPEEFFSIQKAKEIKNMQISYSPLGTTDVHVDNTLNVYLPVFERPEGMTDAFEEGKEASELPSGQLRGIAIGRFLMPDIVDRALSNLSPSGIDIEIEFTNPDASETSVYVHHSRLRQHGAAIETEPVEGTRTMADTIEIAGHKWRIICVSVPGTFQPDAWTAWLVVVGGTAFTLLLAAYVVSLIGRAEEVARLVSRRTLELQHANEALNRQIVERIKAEEALQALNATLEQRVARRAAESERRASELEQFAYVSSHDLKAPLRAVANLAQWLEEDLVGKLNDETREKLSLVRDRVRRMHDLIEGLLTYSRIGRVNGKRERVDSATLVAEIVDSIAPPQGFDIEISSTMPQIDTDRMQLSQVFANLIGNSVKHHDNSVGHIQVSGQCLEGVCEFSVTDDGPGIPAEYHDKVFKMFQTLQVKDFGTDTGIGLALVKKIVEEHGGTITLISGAGRGTDMRFTWVQDRHGGQ